MTPKINFEVLARAIVLVLFTFGLAIVFPYKPTTVPEFEWAMGAVQSFLPALVMFVILIGAAPEWARIRRLAQRVMDRQAREAAVPRWTAAFVGALAMIISAGSADGVVHGVSLAGEIFPLIVATAFAYFAFSPDLIGNGIAWVQRLPSTSEKNPRNGNRQ